MIEINLLPRELRVKKKNLVTVPRIPVVPIAAGILALLIASHFVLTVAAMRKRSTLEGLESVWEEMKPQREKTGKIFNDISELEKKVVALRGIAKPDLDWTRMLSGLNQSVIPNIWLSDFKLMFKDKRSRLRTKGDIPVSLELTGYALGKSQEATSLVAKFITSLKAHEDFGTYFDDIELKNMRNSQIDEEEVMMFELDCKFREIKTVPVEDEMGRK